MCLPQRVKAGGSLPAANQTGMKTYRTALKLALPLALVAALLTPCRSQSTDRRDADLSIAAHREAIDAIDQQLVDLLNQRARHALAIGRARAGANIDPASAKGRQQVVIDRAKRGAVEPFSPDAAGRIFERIIAESVAMQAADAALRPAAQTIAVRRPTGPGPAVK